MPRILLADEDAKTLNILSTLLRSEGYKVVPVRGMDKAVNFIKSRTYDLVVSDLSSDGAAQLEALHSLRQERPEVPVIVLHGPMAEGVEARLNELEVNGRFAKPLKAQDFLGKVQKIVDFGEVESNGSEEASRRGPTLVSGYEQLVAESPQMRKVLELVKRLAPADVPIMIVGEPGTPREQVARAIHYYSRVRDKEFVELQCAGDGQGLEELLAGNGAGAPARKSIFEDADGSTLFLDEIEAVPLSLQNRILGVLREGKVVRANQTEIAGVKPRVVVGTNIRLEQMVKTGRFIPELFRCISAMPLHLKPLRECREDIIPWLEKSMNTRLGGGAEPPAPDKEAVAVLEAYPWPGNLRELDEAADYIIKHAEGDSVTVGNLPPQVAAAG